MFTLPNHITWTLGTWIDFNCADKVKCPNMHPFMSWPFCTACPNHCLDCDWDSTLNGPSCKVTSCETGYGRISDGTCAGKEGRPLVDSFTLPCINLIDVILSWHDDICGSLNLILTAKFNIMKWFIMSEDLWYHHALMHVIYKAFCLPCIDVFL